MNGNNSHDKVQQVDNDCVKEDDQQLCGNSESTRLSYGRDDLMCMNTIRSKEFLESGEMDQNMEINVLKQNMVKEDQLQHRIVQKVS